MSGTSDNTRFIARRSVTLTVLATGLVLAFTCARWLDQEITRYAAERATVSARAASADLSLSLATIGQDLGQLRQSGVPPEQIVERLRSIGLPASPLPRSPSDGLGDNTDPPLRFSANAAALFINIGRGRIASVSAERLLPEQADALPLRIVPATSPPGAHEVRATVSVSNDTWAIAAPIDPERLPGVIRVLPVAGGLAIAIIALLGYFCIHLLRTGRSSVQNQIRQASRRNQGDHRKLLDLIDQSADWSWESDAAHRYTHISEGIRTRVRLDPADYLGHRFWDVPHQNLPQSFWQEFRKTLERHQEFSCTVDRIDLDGALRHLELTGRPVFDRQGRLLGYRGIGRDVTERIEAARSLKASEERFRDLVSLCSDWYWEQDADLRFTEIATDGARRGPQIHEAWLGRTLNGILVDGAAVPGWKSVQRRLASHQAFSGFEFEISGDRPDAGCFAISGRPLIDPVHGFCGYRGVVREITAEREIGKALAESEARYRASFENAPVGIASIDPGGGWVEVNNTLCALLGYRRQPLLERSFESITHPADRTACRDAMAQLTSGEGNNFLIEMRLLHRDGKDRWVRLHATLLRDRVGAPDVFLFVFENITERVAAMRALHASELLYRRLVDLSPDGIFLHREGRLILANPACVRLLGAGEERNLLGRSVLELVMDEDKPKISMRVAELQAAAGDGTATPLQVFSYRRLDSAPVQAESTEVSVMLEDGPAVLCVLRDIRDRLEAEKSLRESDARYRDVVESVNEVIFQLDHRGRFNFLSKAWESVSGFGVEESMGSPLLEFLHPDDREKLTRRIANMQGSRGEPCEAEFRLRTANGEIRWIEATARQVDTNEPGGGGIRGSLDDISSRKIAELTLKNLNQELESRVRVRTAELEASNRELEAFSYSVSHDLRAPLRAIDGFAHVLEEDFGTLLDVTGCQYLRRIRAASNRMANLIDDLLELARLTRQTLRKETVDLSQLTLQIAEELRAETPLRSIDLEVTPGLVAQADRILIQVVLENLLRNAWKFTADKPHAKIRFLAERRKEVLAYCVADNGIGFDMDHAAKLFQPFQRLHGQNEYEGSGIGLATVQRIIQRHGGETWAESMPANGARFYFTLN